MKHFASFVVIMMSLSATAKAGSSVFDPDSFTGIYRITNPECLSSTADHSDLDVLVLAKKMEDGNGLVRIGWPLGDEFSTKKISQTNKGDDFGPYIDKTTNSFENNRFKSCWRRVELMLILPVFDSQCKTLERESDGDLLYSGKPSMSRGQNCILSRDPDPSFRSLAAILVKKRHAEDAAMVMEMMKRKFYQSTTTESERSQMREAASILRNEFGSAIDKKF